LAACAIWHTTSTWISQSPVGIIYCGICVCVAATRFVCPTEITAFSDRHAEFKAINTEILGVSVDSQFSHLAWIQTDRKEGELLRQHC